jgi:TonB-linked SusC/RagA family outer membrane protein
MTCVVFGQQTSRRITGIVTDTKGEALIGASVTVQGQTSGSITDIDGKFALTAKTGDKLSVSYLGYVTATVTVDAQNDYSVILQEDEASLSEVVVVGYGSLEKRQLTNAISSISARDLPQGLGGSSVANSMKGKVTNLDINDTPSPNSDPSFQLRGLASINSSPSPLIIIDGVVGGDIQTILQEDIERIDVLKDAGAGAIYGVRATGGVILVTTKKAQEGKVRLSYNSEAIYKSAFGKPRVLTASEFREYKANVPGADKDPDHEFGIDWWDYGLADNPVSNRQTVTVQGGAPNARLYASFMYEDNKGVVLYDTRKDLGGRINGNFKVADGWLDINTHVNYRQAKRNESSVGVGGMLWTNPTANPAKPEDWSPDADGRPTVDEPVRTAQLKLRERLEKWFNPDVELILNVLPVQGLKYHQTFAYENHQYEYHRYDSSKLRKGQTDTNTSGTGTAALEFDKKELMNIEGYLQYIRNFGDLHNIHATAGYSYTEHNGENFGMKNFQFSDDRIALWNIGSGTSLSTPPSLEAAQATMSSTKMTSYKLFARFGRLNYTLMDRYLVSGTLRLETTSRFNKKYRLGTFGQASAAWRISKENFMQNVSWLDDLKLRFSFGVTGTEIIEATQANVVFKALDNQVLMPDGTWITPYEISDNVNQNLKWEEKHEWNIGLDYELFNRRISGKIDFYSRKMKDLIFYTPAPNPPYIYQDYYVNVGDLDNRGIEFEIGANIVNTKDWQYSTKFLISHNTTKVGKMGNSGQKLYASPAMSNWRAGDTHLLEEGTTVGSFFLYKFAGFSDGSDKYQHTVTKDDGTTVVENIPAGEMLVYAKDADGKTIVVAPMIDTQYQSDDNKHYVGNYQPKAIIGWSHDVQYKNWSLGMSLISWIDFDILNAIQAVYGFQNGGVGDYDNAMLIAYTKHKDVTGRPIASDYFLEDGTFLKIQNITLGYRINTKKYLKMMESARLYLTLGNVYTFTKYSGFNPEVNVQGYTNGYENAIYPQTRTYALGLQLNF